MDMIIPWEKCNFHKEQCFPQERPKFLGETYVPNLFVITTISYPFLYGLVTYHEKSLEENYNFVIGITLIRIHLKTLQSH
jgi:hypothetical protein